MKNPFKELGVLRKFFAGMVASLALTTVLAPPRALGQEVIVTISSSAASVVAGKEASVWVNVLNPGAQEAKYTYPETISCHLTSGAKTSETTLKLRNASEAGSATIPANGFARKEYVFTPPSTVKGTVLLAGSVFGAQRLALEVGKESAVARTQPAEPAEKTIEVLPEGTYLKDPDTFFKQHVYPHDPLYFIVGTRAPNTKFQVSLKYRLISSEGPVTSKVPALKDLYFGFSQTSLWDWSKPSAPFFDSSYRPEILYYKDAVNWFATPDWFQIGLQSGVRHESNGRDGTNSRSMNTIYFQPAFHFGTTNDPVRLTLSPRAWMYLGDLSDNPDVARYRGYVDLRAVLDFPALYDVQLASHMRVGHNLDRGSVEVDLTYPLYHLPGLRWNVFFLAQYFNGYGESPLLYNKRVEQYRFGFSLSR